MIEGWAPGPFAVDYEQRLNFEVLRNKRVDRARSEMQAAGVDALLVWKDENVRYLTSLRPQLIAGKSGLLNGALLLSEGAPILFVSGGDYDRTKRGMPCLDEVYPIPILEEEGLTRHFVSAIFRDVVTRHHLSRTRIGLDLASQGLHTALRELFPDIHWVNGNRVMQQARLIKLPEEVALLEEATAIAEAVTQTAIESVRPGIRETDVAAEAVRSLYRLGGEYAHVVTPFVASGERMSPPTRVATDKLIRHGDIVFIDIGAMFNGYFADVGRTIICGTPSHDQYRVFRAVYEAHRAGLEAMRPGVPTDRSPMRLGARRLSMVWRSTSSRCSSAMGIGVGSNEPPYIGEIFPGAADVELRPRMVFALEPLIWVSGILGGGGVRLEDMVLITEGEPRVLSRVPYDQRLLEAE